MTIFWPSRILESHDQWFMRLVGENERLKFVNSVSKRRVRIAWVNLGIWSSLSSQDLVHHRCIIVDLNCCIEQVVRRKLIQLCKTYVLSIISLIAVNLQIPRKGSLCHTYYPSHRVWGASMTPNCGQGSRWALRPVRQQTKTVRSSDGRTPMLDEAGETLPIKSFSS